MYHFNPSLVAFRACGLQLPYDPIYTRLAGFSDGSLEGALAVQRSECPFS